MGKENKKKEKGKKKNRGLRQLFGFWKLHFVDILIYDLLVYILGLCLCLFYFLRRL